MSQGKRMKGEKDYVLINASNHLAGMHTGQVELSIYQHRLW